jgi:phosphate transport system substrate-binding protein
MIVLAYNLIGFKGELRLPRDLYPEILAGNVKYWDDPRIQAANPNVRLPHRGVVVAARLDSSGTIFALSRHLAEINRNWRDSGLGVGKLVAWRGAMLARGNEGVAHLIKISDGVIGYVEFCFAARLGLPMVALENKAGKFIAPTDAAGRATMAAAGDDVPDDLRSYLADPEGDQAYPIITLSWLALHERYRNPVKGAALKEFVGWGLTEGQAFGTKLGYVPLPASLSGRSRQALSAVN